MRIAIPLAEGRLSLHFGHCDSFALVEVDPATRRILNRREVEAPPHEPGVLPRWLAQRGVSVVLAGGMGQRAQKLFAEEGIQVVAGAGAEEPDVLVSNYLNGTLERRENVCDH